MQLQPRLFRAGFILSSFGLRIANQVFPLEQSFHYHFDDYKFKPQWELMFVTVMGYHLSEMPLSATT